MTRHTRYRNERGEEWEYDYEYDDETEDGETIRLRRMVGNENDETIEPISSMKNRLNRRPQEAALDVQVAPDLDKSNTGKSDKEGSRLPVALFLSEDKRRHGRGTGVLEKPKARVVDLSEYESEANINHSNPLANLIPRLRAEKELGTGEELMETLRQLEAEIAARTAVRDGLKDKIDELQRPLGRKKHRFQFSGIKTTNIMAPPDPIKILALNDFNRRSVASQTDCTNDSINYQLSVLEKQKVERKAAEELQGSLQSLQQKIAATQEMIEEAKRDGEMKEPTIQQLKTEIGNVKDELEREDSNALQEEEKAREYAKELDRVDQQIRVK